MVSLENHQKVLPTPQKKDQPPILLVYRSRDRRVCQVADLARNLYFTRRSSAACFHCFPTHRESVKTMNQRSIYRHLAGPTQIPQLKIGSLQRKLLILFLRFFSLLLGVQLPSLVWICGLTLAFFLHFGGPAKMARVSF